MAGSEDFEPILPETNETPPQTVNVVPETKPEVTTTFNKELGLDKPSPFDGDRKKTETFIQECKIYLQINKRIYSTDETQVAFILSLMKEKEALRWKQTYIKTLLNTDGDLIFPKVKDFVGLIIDYFQPINQVVDAAHQLMMLRQGKKTAEEVITEFRLLTSQAGYTCETPSDHLHLIGKLQNILNPSLVKKILLLDNPPVTINDWVRKAITIDGQYRATMDILNRRINDGKPSKEGTKRTWSNNYRGKSKEERDPNAMDVDAMSTEKRAALMRKGACFICEETGHMAKDHNDFMKKKKTNIRKTTTTTPSSSSKPKSIKEIHALLQALSPTETKELLALQSTDQEEPEEESDF